MIRRLSDYRATFGDDDPLVFILAPAAERPIPAGDTRRGTVWIFRADDAATRFAAWVAQRHRMSMVVVGVRLRHLAGALAERDLTWVLDPQPQPGHGNPLTFKAPLAH